MEITIKSITGNVTDKSTSIYIFNWQVQYDAIFPEADLTKGYHSTHGIIGWKGDPQNINKIIEYIKSFYK